MSLQTIRGIFPHPSADQQILIGSRCLALTTEERNLINTMSNPADLLNAFAHITENQEEAQRRQRFINIARQSLQALGEIGGGIGGGWLGSKMWTSVSTRIGVVPSTVNVIVSVVCMILGGAIGTQVGGVVGDAVSEFMQEMRMMDRTYDLVFRRELVMCEEWQAKVLNERVFPVLAEFATHDELAEFYCPITRDWIREPVIAKGKADQHIYEKMAILEHFRRFEEQHPLAERVQMTPIACDELELQTSPFRSCRLKVEDLKLVADYRDRLFLRMRQVYNTRVAAQQRMTAPGVTPRQYARIAQRSHIDQEQMNHIVTFYSLRTPTQRHAIAEQMIHEVRRGDLPNEQLFAVIKKIEATAVLPERLLNTPAMVG